MGEPFLGVQLPEPGEAPEVQSAPESAPQAPEPKSDGFELGNGKTDLGEAAKPELTKQELVDLDKHERFRWQGKEWSQKDFRSGHLMREDYTRKTQELAEARKYVENFDADLAKVVENPNLFEEFRQVYPAQYHAIAQRILDRMNPTRESAPSGVSQPTQAADVEKVVQSLLEKQLKPLHQWREQVEKEKEDAVTKATLAEVDGWFEKAGRKYPFANETEVNALAHSAAQQGHKITEGVIERLMRDSHERFEKRADERQKKQVEEQKKANAKARDIGPGGGTPAAPMPKMSMKDVRKKLLADLDAS